MDRHRVAALERGQVAPIQLDGTTRGPLKTRDESAHRRLTATRFAHEAVGLALLDGNRHAVHGGNNALVALEEAGTSRLVLARGLLDVEQDLRGHQRGLLCPGLVPVFLRVELCLQSCGRLVTLLHRVEAGEGVVLVPAQVGVGCAALVGGPQAAGCEAASYRQVGQRRGSAGDREELGAGREGALGQRSHERACVAVLRLREQCLRRGRLDDAPGVHDGDAVGVTGDDTQVVGDEDDAHLVLVAQLVDEVEDLHLRRHVESRRRFVGDQDARLAYEGHGDHDALTHTARELVRVVVDDHLGARHTHTFQDLDGPFESFLRGELLVNAQRLAHLKADLHGRVQGCERILEDHADLRAAQLALLLQRTLRQVLSVQNDLAGGDGASLGEQTHEGQGGHRLTGAGFTHDAQGFARVNVQVDTGEGVDHAGADLNVSVEVPDVQERRVSHSSSHLLRSRTSKASRRPSPMKLNDKTSRIMRTPGG